MLRTLFFDRTWPLHGVDYASLCGPACETPNPATMSSSIASNGLFDMHHVDFDFNLPFEQLFLSILPSALFILSSGWRIVLQRRRPHVVHARALQLIKLVRQHCGLEHANRKS